MCNIHVEYVLIGKLKHKRFTGATIVQNLYYFNSYPFWGGRDFQIQLSLFSIWCSLVFE